MIQMCSKLLLLPSNNNTALDISAEDTSAVDISVADISIVEISVYW